MVTEPLQPLTLLENAPLYWREQLLPAADADQLLDALLTSLTWHRPHVQVYGQRHPVPRQVAWCADQGVDYSYAGHCHDGQGWPPLLLQLKRTIESVCDKPFNAVLLNRYDNGRHSMGYHRDNEAELGPRPWVASYSLGATRDFTFRPWLPDAGGSRRQCARVALPHNSLLLMSPACQTYYEHALPRRAHQQGSRINLTFRLIYPKNK